MVLLFMYLLFRSKFWMTILASIMAVASALAYSRADTKPSPFLSIRRKNDSFKSSFDLDVDTRFTLKVERWKIR